MDLLRPLMEQLPPSQAALLAWAAFLLLAGWYWWRVRRGWCKEFNAKRLLVLWKTVNIR